MSSKDRMAAVKAVSVPTRVNVAPKVATSTTSSRRPNHSRTPGIAVPGAVARGASRSGATPSSPRTGGFRPIRTRPAPSISTAMPTNVAPDPAWVAATTPSAGPMAKEISTDIESREKPA